MQEGDIVIVHGLKAREDLNGAKVSIVKAGEGEERWEVATMDGVMIRVRPSNLQSSGSLVDVAEATLIAENRVLIASNTPTAIHAPPAIFGPPVKVKNPKEGPNPFAPDVVRRATSELNVEARGSFCDGVKTINEWMAAAEPPFSERLKELAAKLYHHGAVAQERDVSDGRTVHVRHGYPREADELVVLLSMPAKAEAAVPSLASLCQQVTGSKLAPDGSIMEAPQPYEAPASRVLFFVSASDQNTCDPGCWCTGTVQYAVHYLLPEGFGSFYSHGEDGCLLGRLLLIGHPNGAYWEMSLTRENHGVMFVGAGDSTQTGLGVHGSGDRAPAELAAALGVEPSEMGAVLRMVFLAANIKGVGATVWQLVENLHGYYGAAEEDDEDANDDEDEGGKLYNIVQAMLYEAPPIRASVGLKHELEFNGMSNPFVPLRLPLDPPHVSASQGAHDKMEELFGRSAMVAVRHQLGEDHEADCEDDRFKKETAAEQARRVTGGAAVAEYPALHENSNGCHGRAGISPRHLLTAVSHVAIDKKKAGIAPGLGALCEALKGWQQAALAKADVSEFFEAIENGYPVGTEPAKADVGEWSVERGDRGMRIVRNCFSTRNLESLYPERLPQPVHELAGMELGRD